MIRAHFGLDRNPFSLDNPPLLPHQQEVFDTLRVHCQQGGLCVVVGDPGTGKSVIKQVSVPALFRRPLVMASHRA